jgi:uncharacterized protein
VDLGVHQDGLVHVSQLSHKFVTDAREVVKTGDIVKVQVLEVDVARKRISLSMKLGAASARTAGDNRFQAANPQQRGRASAKSYGTSGGPGPRAASSAPQSTSMSSAFAKLKGLNQ